MFIHNSAKSSLTHMSERKVQQMRKWVQKNNGLLQGQFVFISNNWKRGTAVIAIKPDYLVNYERVAWGSNRKSTMPPPYIHNVNMFIGWKMRWNDFCPLEDTNRVIITPEHKKAVIIITIKMLVIM